MKTRIELVHNPNLFIISGGPGSGKTTTLMELEKCGFLCAPEVARQIIQEQVRDGGQALPWKDRRLYADLMLRRSIESYKQHTPAWNPVFSDRGIPDALGYARLIELPEQRHIRRACDHYRYATRVFLASPWREIYKTDNERRQGFAEAERTCQELLKVYKECGYEVFELPRLAPRARAEFVLHHLHEGV